MNYDSEIYTYIGLINYTHYFTHTVHENPIISGNLDCRIL